MEQLALEVVLQCDPSFCLSRTLPTRGFHLAGPARTACLIPFDLSRRLCPITLSTRELHHIRTARASHQ